MKDLYNLYEGILRDIENGLKSNIRTEDLADKYSLSNTHLRRLFKYEFGQSIGSYIRSRKLASSIEELKTTDKNILDIALDYGFEYEQSYIRSLKNELGVTPNKLRKACEKVKINPSLRLLDNNMLVNMNGFKYELWQDKQMGNPSMFLKGEGLIKCKWDDINYINFRSGKSFDETKTHSQLGPIDVDYGFCFNSKCDSWRGIYGWTVDPLIEFYIVENGNLNEYLNELPKKIADINGEKYYVFEKKCLNQPSVKGVQSFKEYWSVRADKRSNGVVPVSEHFNTWEKMGMELGKMFEISVAIVGYQNSGNAEIYRNLVSIGDTIFGSKGDHFVSL